MRSYRLSDKYKIATMGYSDGEQNKYYRNGYYYKINKHGNEGYVDYLVSLFLSCTSLGEEEYVKYEYCKINDKLGCRSKSFLKEGEDFISASTLYKRLYGGGDLSDFLASLQEA